MPVSDDILNSSCQLGYDHKPVTYASGYQKGMAWLSEAGVSNAGNEALWLLESVLGITRLDIHTKPETTVGRASWSRVVAAFHRRASGEPLQYILGTQEFRGLEITVRPGVLIPRIETELIIEMVHALVPCQKRLVMADVGTGSGCLAVALALEFPESIIFATDCSELALEVAETNARRHSVQERIRFQRGDLLESLGRFPELDHGLSIIVSNPPYIPTEQLGNLQREVRDFEPRIALDGGSDGLVFYRRLLGEALSLLQPNGWMVLEVGEGQAPRICKEIDGHESWSLHHVRQDDAGIDRVMALERKG